VVLTWNRTESSSRWSTGPTLCIAGHQNRQDYVEVLVGGKWVLRTDTGLPTEEVALRYKNLLVVEFAFRTAKSILEVRPIYHKCDDTIRGHVFCSFLALVLLKELQARMESCGWQAEWQCLRDDLDELHELILPLGEKNFVIRTPPVGSASQCRDTLAGSDVANRETISAKACSDSA
jgi:transposase